MVFKHTRNKARAHAVWEWCKDIWYSNREPLFVVTPSFENDVKIYGIQTETSAPSRVDMFENDVKIYGIQTARYTFTSSLVFENDVKIYGIQTLVMIWQSQSMFENDVKIYGIQTHLPAQKQT